MKIKISSSMQLTTHFRSLRRSKGWTQADLGRRIGVTQSRIAQIESDPSLISVDQLIQILHVLDANLMIDLNHNSATSVAGRLAAGGLLNTHLNQTHSKSETHDADSVRFTLLNQDRKTKNTKTSW